MSSVIVYSYSRWSTPEQSKGDSNRRQRQAAERWAAEHNYVLDEERCILDNSCSAYRGDNAIDGGLGRFLDACRKGLIEPGSILLVESLDRISRMPPRKAQRLIDDIVDGGVTIVTMCDDQCYTADRLDNDPLALLLALMVSWRAHEESKTKALRVASAWEEKRRRVRSNPAEVLTFRGPGWLQRSNGRWEENRSKSDIVRRIFAMRLSGLGEYRIAAVLNEESIPTLSRGAHWHRSTVCKLLRNAAVTGRLTPGKIKYVNGRRLRVLEDPIDGAFPAIVTLEDWLAVKALKDGASGGPRGQHAGNGVAHYFAGLAKCPICNATMSRVNKGCSKKGGAPKLVCTVAKSKAGCRYLGVPIVIIEDALLSRWPALLDSCAPERQTVDMDGDRGSDETVNLKETGLPTSNRLATQRLRTLFADVEGRLDRAQVNTALKTVFTSVQIDYEERVLRFKSRAGGAWAMPY